MAAPSLGVASSGSERRRPTRGRRRFLDNLLYAASVPGGRSAVVLTLRADFYPKAAVYSELAQLVAAHQHLLGPLDEAGRRAVIEEPARRVGLEFEAGLVDTILDDTGHEPGALPLLEHALLELWERRRGRMLTLEAYRESGGVERAIAKRADDVFSTFTPEQQLVARRTFLRLTQPGQGTEDTRRRAAVSELESRSGDSDAVDEVLRVLIEARMLIAGGDDVADERWIDVSHEALIRGWPRLRAWLDEARTGLLVHRRITEATAEWDRLDREASVLYRGTRLTEARRWRDLNEAALNDREWEFITASVRLEAKERFAHRRRVGLRIGVPVLAVAFIGLGVWAINQRERADRGLRVGDSRHLAGLVDGQLAAENDRRAILLALEAIGAAPTDEAREAVEQIAASLDVAQLAHVLPPGRGETSSLSMSTDGTRLAAANAGNVFVWNTRTRKPIQRLRFAAADLALSADGGVLAAVGDAGITVTDLHASRSKRLEDPEGSASSLLGRSRRSA